MDIGEENLSLRSYKTYESGKGQQMPLLDKLVILAEYFQVSLDFLVFSKSSTYDDSYSKKDELKRFARLIYSLVLCPAKENDANNPYYGKYYFMVFDKDVSLYLNKLETYWADKNHNYEYRGVNQYGGIDDFDEIINEIDGLDENWAPTYERFAYLQMESGINPEQYKNDWIEKISKKRAAEQYRQKSIKNN